MRINQIFSLYNHFLNKNRSSGLNICEISDSLIAVFEFKVIESLIDLSELVLIIMSDSSEGYNDVNYEGIDK